MSDDAELLLGCTGDLKERALGERVRHGARYHA